MSRASADIQQRWRSFCEERGLKATRQRQAIVKEFVRSREHVSIDELLGRVRRQHPRIGYVTVYRTLKLLTEAGLAVARHFGDGQTRYEVADEATEGHHDHLICIDCGLIIEFEHPEIERLQEEVARRLGFEVQSHKLELYGRCPLSAAGCDRRCPHAQTERVAPVAPGGRAPVVARLGSRARRPTRGRSRRAPPAGRRR